MNNDNPLKIDVPTIDDPVNYFPMFNGIIHNKQAALDEIPSIPTNYLPYGCESLEGMLRYLANAAEIITEIRDAYRAEIEQRK